MWGELGVTQIREFLEDGNLAADVSEIQLVDNLLWEMMFSIFLTQLEHLGKLGAIIILKIEWCSIFKKFVDNELDAVGP